MTHKKKTSGGKRSTPGSKASSATPRIFQIWYRPEQQPRLDPAFEPYDNREENSALLEFRVLAELSQREDLAKVPLWGAVSWKFGQKTGLTGHELVERIAQTPGYDAYYCNPYPDVEALYHNMWLQGETAHPNFLALCREVFEVAGLPASLLTEIQPAEEFASCNYIVATPAFWKRYVGFVSRVLLAADRKLSPTARSILYSPSADPVSAHGNASYIPFLVERLFAVFMRTEGRDLRAHKIAVNRDATNAHVKLLGEMKSFALKTRSSWMASCWINYRNLYLDRLYGNGWSRKYIKTLTPTEIVLGGCDPVGPARVNPIPVRQAEPLSTKARTKAGTRANVRTTTRTTARLAAAGGAVEALSLQP